ncbi:MAG: M23 family metallopeptidase [Campylobacteraceae bacterium]
MKIFKLFILLFIFALHVNAKDYANGQVAILEFDKNGSVELLRAGKIVNLNSHPTNSSKLIALVPISYYEKNNITLTKIENGKLFDEIIEVKQKAYKKETLSVDSSKVNPPLNMQERIAVELKEAKAIYATYTNKRYWNSKFLLPMNSTITSEYGNARVYNGELKSYHSGTDFRASVGTPIFAVNDGRVVLVKDRYYAGLSVIVDHGEGVYTTYFHLSKTNVQPGDVVKKSELLGLSGDSGRVTGPHLHFGIVVGGISIDPMQFINDINYLF